MPPFLSISGGQPAMFPGSGAPTPALRLSDYMFRDKNQTIRHNPIKSNGFSIEEIMKQ